MARVCCCCCWSMMMMVLVLFIFFFEGGEAYKNYTVGGSLGWYDNLQVPNADYQKWADGYNFSLGDFLLFNTDTNHSVVQTSNLTTYKSCDFNIAAAADTTEWSTAEPSADNKVDAVTIAVPLLKEGQTYFFSGDYDGEQCEHGQRFKITVGHGHGLPPSLRPADSAPGPNSADYASSTPDTTVPSNFDTPKETDDDGTTVKATSAAGGVQAGPWRSSMWVVIIVALLKVIG